MLGSFPPELLVVMQQPVYSGRRSRRCHVISYQQLTARCLVWRWFSVVQSFSAFTRCHLLAENSPHAIDSFRRCRRVECHRFFSTTALVGNSLWIEDV